MRVTAQLWRTQVVAIVKALDVLTFFFLRLQIFCDASSFSTDVLSAWRTACQVAVNALTVLTIRNHSRSLKRSVIQDFSSELLHAASVTCSCENGVRGWKTAFVSSVM